MDFRRTEPPPAPMSQPQQHPPPPLSYGGYRNPGFGMGNGLYNQGLGRSNDFFRLGIGQAGGSFQMMNNVSAHPELLRELEKQRIREEIISGDIVRRRVLEEEVRAELMMEKELRLRRSLVQAESGGLVAGLRGISYAREASKGMFLEERIGMRSEDGLKMLERSEIQGFDMVPFQQRSTESMVQEVAPSSEEAGLAVKPRVFSFLQEVNKQLSLEQRISANSEESFKTQPKCEIQSFDVEPFQRRSVASKDQDPAPSVTENGKQKEKIVFLVKPSADQSGTKRKFESAGQVSVEYKRGKKTWTCDVCQVYATSERGLNDHMVGKKHKAMEDALNGKNIGVGFVPKTTAEPIAEATSAVPNHPGELKVRRERVKKFAPAQKIKDKSKFPLWCEMCQVGAYSKTVMEAHRNGKMHSAMLSEKS